ncbi:hypothetical protein [Tumebacillus permanentifrigoris]|uniref:Uncharacterized protein n=1 Tax=Tumebacillus permanentifrigoris TaxID=378543 RepID=A0A316D217_9BACL|nr:hypothetical protein [Tumebacillus permanentifrigoris]PWK03931.1 hypothetical protein C7459_14319 [Tumebacillus permanentifrigoris]
MIAAYKGHHALVARLHDERYFVGAGFATKLAELVEGETDLFQKAFFLDVKRLQGKIVMGSPVELREVLGELLNRHPEVMGWLTKATRSYQSA